MTLSEWIDSQPFQYNKVNVRLWGSFELQVTIDGRSAHLTEVRGWGWTEKDAFQDVLTNMVRDGKFHHNLSLWLGDTRFQEVVSIIKANPAEEPDGIGDRKKIPSQVERVEEVGEDNSNDENQAGIPEQRRAGEDNPIGRLPDNQGENESVARAQ